MELNGRVALVTGGAGGIGGAVVRRLAKAGVSGVVINYRRSAKEAEALALEIERAGVKSMAIQADIQNDGQVKSMIAKIRADFGRLDILVNNAGVTHWVKVSDLEALTDAITLRSGSLSVFDSDGSAIVIHATSDDYMTDPAGNSGDRVACGVIVQNG